MNNCFICRKFEGASFDYPKIVRLPDVRVNFGFPYSSINIDYSGPDYVKNIYATNDNNLYKTWIVLIRCFSSRCICRRCCYRLLWTFMYRTFEFRFVKIHVAPNLVISDNGTCVL